MNEEKKLAEIKNEDSKKKPIFFIVLAVLCVLGGFLGFLWHPSRRKWILSLTFLKTIPRF